jgi:hypothetical protein
MTNVSVNNNVVQIPSHTYIYKKRIPSDHVVEAHYISNLQKKEYHLTMWFDNMEKCNIAKTKAFSLIS